MGKQLFFPSFRLQTSKKQNKVIFHGRFQQKHGNLLHILLI